MCLTLHQRGKWQNKPILRPHYMYACGPCFRKKQPGIEILFWQQTCCSQPLEWLKPVKKYHRSLPACMLHGMCNAWSKTTQNKNTLYSVKTDMPHLRKNNQVVILYIFFHYSCGKMDTGKDQWETLNVHTSYLQKSLFITLIKHFAIWFWGYNWHRLS